MKIAPIMHALSSEPGVAAQLIHTGQHYDDKMSHRFFDELGIPAPTVNLEVGSGSHAQQTAEVMKRIEPVLIEHKPDWIVVVGDVNSTLAAALVAKKLGINIAHVEAGLRSFDSTMPEEVNRILTDAISDLLFVTEPSGVENLSREGITGDRIHLVGNVMIDTLLRWQQRADGSTVLEELGVKPDAYVLATLHRPSNVDRAGTYSQILEALHAIGEELPVIFPIHPRSRDNLEKLGLATPGESTGRVRLVEPLGYMDFLKLMTHAAAVLTDSGGIQEETTALGVPCLTLRENTERPITITEGTNRLAGTSRDAILSAWKEVRSTPKRPTQRPALWDGATAQRIVNVLLGRDAEVDRSTVSAVAASNGESVSSRSVAGMVSSTETMGA